jgi:hypothetical protein
LGTFFKNFLKALACYKDLAALGGVSQHPHFLKLAPTLGSVESSIPQGLWRFHFFSNFIFPKFRVHLDLHIYHWDFCFIKT